MRSQSSLLPTEQSSPHQVSKENNSQPIGRRSSLIFAVSNLFIIAKSHPSQMRPRSRCLTTVHQEILNDIVSILLFCSRERVPNVGNCLGICFNTLFRRFNYYIKKFNLSIKPARLIKQNSYPIIFLVFPIQHHWKIPENDHRWQKTPKGVPRPT